MPGTIKYESHQQHLGRRNNEADVEQRGIPDGTLSFF